MDIRVSSRSTRYRRPVAVTRRTVRGIHVARPRYALDDGMPFPGWAPSLLTDDEAEAGYEAGERIAVIAGDPADPVAGLVLDTRNSRLTVRPADPPCSLSYRGADLALAEAVWTDAEDRQCWARRAAAHRLRVVPATDRRRGLDRGIACARAERRGRDRRLARLRRVGRAGRAGPPPWVQEDALDLIDADGWILDALEDAGVLTQWRELGRKYDAPRAFGLPAEMQVKLAEPLGWEAAGRRWRKSERARTTRAKVRRARRHRRTLRGRSRCQRRDRHDRHVAARSRWRSTSRRRPPRVEVRRGDSSRVAPRARRPELRWPSRRSSRPVERRTTPS